VTGADFADGDIPGAAASTLATVTAVVAFTCGAGRSGDVTAVAVAAAAEIPGAGKSAANTGNVASIVAIDRIFFIVISFISRWVLNDAQVPPANAAGAIRIAKTEASNFFIVIDLLG
jgi:hypothetical protein